MLRSIACIVKNLNMDIIKDAIFDLVIRRSHVLSDALRKIDKASFDN